MADPVVKAKCSNGYCEVPGGTFKMGSRDGDADEKPVKTVTMTGFELGQTEVSVGEYKKFLEAQPGTKFKAVLSGCGSADSTQTIPAKKGESEAKLRERAAQTFVKDSCEELKIVTQTPQSLPDFENNKKGDNYPVVGLTFDEKRAYCQAEGGDLPTAAQLHYTSRNDDDPKYEDQLVIWDNGFRSTEPVTAGYQNAYGIYNLLGNVWESALDAYDKLFYKRMPNNKDPYNPLTNPKVTAEDWDDPAKQWQEFSGGSYSDNRWLARPADRSYGRPGLRLDDDGFRCARPLPQDVEEKK